MSEDVEVGFASGAELQQKLLKGDLGPESLAKMFLDRIELLNPKICAYLRTTPDLAFEQARKVVASLKNKTLGPLEGIPVSLPETDDLEGSPTSLGSLWLEMRERETDGLLARRLKEAGAILLGKSNMAEFGFGPVCENLITGPARNPWDLECYSGGPSGGAAAAVAAGLTTAAVVGDVVGSARISGNFCGVFSLKPTRGRVPVVSRGVNPPSEYLLLQKGVLSRFVRDSAALLSVMAEPDSRDFGCTAEPAPDFLGGLEEELGPLQAGWSSDLGFVKAENSVLEVTEDVVGQFREVGVQVAPVSVELSEDILFHARNMIAADRFHVILQLKENRGEFFKQLTETTRDWLSLGNNVTGVQYSLASTYINWLGRYLDQVMKEIDLLITPVSPLHHLPIGGEPFEVNGVALDPYLGVHAYTVPFNFSGYPAMTLPCGFTDDKEPIGIQVVAKPFQEKKLLQLASLWERRFPWQRRRPHGTGISRRQAWG